MTQVDIEAGHWDIIHPAQSLGNATEVEFNAAAGPLFTDLANSYIKVRLSVSKIGGAIVAADALSLTNLIAHSHWSKINIYVSGVDVTDGNRYYPYTAIMLTLLLFGFYKVTAGKMDDHAAANAGFVAWKVLVVAAAVGNTPTLVEVTIHPYLGAFQLHRLIPDRTVIRLELHRSKDAFALIHNDVAGASVKVDSAQWHLRQVRLSDSTRSQIDAALVREKALFPITRFRVFSESFKSQSIDFMNVLVCAIPTLGFQGSNKLNPFNFANYGLTRR